jgi:hypothetical protein
MRGEFDFCFRPAMKPLTQILMPGAYLFAFAASPFLPAQDGKGDAPPLEQSIVLNSERASLIKEKKITVSSALDWLRANNGHRADKAGETPVTGPFFAEVFGATCERAEPAELRDLQRIMEGLPAEAHLFKDCFGHYVVAQLRASVAKWQRERPKVSWPALAVTPPAALDESPPEFREAWLLARTVQEPYRKLLKTAMEEKPGPAKRKSEQLEGDLRALVARPEGAWRILLAHEWESACGTGMEDLYHPRNRGILLSLLAEGKIPEVLGCLFDQVAMSGRGPAISELTRDLCTALGLDWELVTLGSLLPDADGGAEAFRDGVKLNRWRSEIDGWPLLAAFGSPRGVRCGLAAARRAWMHELEALAFLSMAAGPEPGPNHFAPVSVGAREWKRKEALPEDVRAEIFALYAKSIDVNRPVEELCWTVRVPRHMVLGLRAPLEKLLGHPSHPIAAEALQRLVEAKLAAVDTPIVPEPPPLKLRVMMNGEPLANASLRARGTGFDTEVRTGKDGRFAVPLRHVLEPGRLNQVEVRSELSANGAIPGLDISPARDIPEIPAKALKSTTWREPWMEVSTPVKVGEDREYELSVTTAPLEITIDPASPVDPKAAITIRLLRFGGEPYFGASIELQGQLRDTFTFERLQLQSYRLEVRAAGAAHYTSDRIDLGRAGSIRLIKLQPGRSVNGRFRLPNGEHRELRFAGHLLRNSQAAVNPGEDWDGLPLGKYRLLIPATAELNAAREKQGIVGLETPPEEQHGGLNHEFELRADSPLVVDLGELHPKPVAGGSKK